MKQIYFWVCQDHGRIKAEWSYVGEWKVQPWNLRGLVCICEDINRGLHIVPEIKVQ